MLSRILLHRNYILLLSFFLMASGFLTAQKNYTSKDSITFFYKLNTMEALIEKRQFDSASSIGTELLRFSETNKFYRGHAWALIKMNDMLIEKSIFTSSAASVKKIIEIGEQLNDKAVTGIGYMQTAQFDMYNNRTGQADLYFEKALKLLPQNNEYTALAWNDRGYNAGATSDLQKQIAYYLKALEISETNKEKALAAMAYSNLAIVYNDLNQLGKAIEAAKKAIELREELNDNWGLSNTYCNLSEIYLKSNLIEAERYAVLCNKAAEKVKDDDKIIRAISTSALVKNYQQGVKSYQGMKDSDLISNLKIIAILEKQNKPSISLARHYLGIGIVMSEARLDSVIALNYLNKGIEMAIAVGNKISIRDGYTNKTVFFKIRGDFYNAYENIKKVHLYKDSIINEKTQTNIAEIQTKYDTEKKDNEITRLNTEQKINALQLERLNTDQKIKQLAIEKQQAVIAGNVLLAKQKEDEIKLLSQKWALQDLEIKQQTEALDKQLLLAKTQKQQLEIADKEKQLSAATIKNQKQLRNIVIGISLLLLTLAGILFNRYQLKKKLDEQKALLTVRDDIAKDLHDDVGSAISSIKILSEVSYKNIEKDKNKSVSLLQKIIAQSEQLQQGISDIVWSVKPDNDKLENMTVRMREYISQVLEPKNIKTNFLADEKVLVKSIGMQQRRDLLMIFKEAVNNIAKYSKATVAEISFEQLNNNLLLKIKDNGIGFDTGKITSSNGLKNMQARALNLNGIFTISSQPEKGTIVELEIPVA
jgi:two-component system, NarL family, sensor histidine kinase UhpB